MDPSSSAVLTDYDGTLAPIVRDPEAARPLARAVDILGRLSQQFAVVGVVSGRPAAFLAANLGAAGPAVHLVGVYGFEWIEDGKVRRSAQVERWLPAATEVLEAARAEAPEGVGIEDKGVSVTLHWRGAPETADWASSFAEEWARRTALALQRGRMAVELRPPIDMDKGKAVERLAAGCTAACFAGDDAGDLAAFEALERLASGGVRTVRIAVADSESPPELAASADVVLQGPNEALDAFEHLARSASVRR